MVRMRTPSSPATAIPSDGMAATYTRIKWHIAPLLIVLYVVAFLDRVNVSFASLTMNRDLHISDSLFGVGAGIFFVGYLLLGVPSNIMLVRFGARRWISIIMIAWGAVSTSMAFTRGPSNYILLRFLLGAAEAGFFPGIILYLTFWLPQAARAGLMALFVIAIPLSSVIGAPLSVWILSFGGIAGLKGWQLLFLVEGAPAIILGILVSSVLAGGPEEVSWLTDEEKRNISAVLEEDRMSTRERSKSRHWITLLTNPSLIRHSCQYLALMIGLYALGFWIPRILSARGVALGRLGWLTALPFAFGAAVMLICSRHSDRSAERKWHLFGSFCCASSGIAIAARSNTWVISLAGLVLAAVGVLSAMPVFWAAATEDFDEAFAPVAIAFINSVGNVGGFVSPLVIGFLLQRTGSYSLGLLFTSLSLLCGAILIALPRGRPFATGTNPLK